MKYGILLYDNGQYGKANKAFKRIVLTNEWRGILHAEALYRIGLGYISLKKLLEAHGLFERVYIGYPAFVEWAALAYYTDAITLIKLKKQEDANKVLAEFYKNEEAYKGTEGYRKIYKDFK